MDFALHGKLLYYAAMDESRDLDEMLASLDALLHEGDSPSNGDSEVPIPVRADKKHVQRDENENMGDVDNPIVAKDYIEADLDVNDGVNDGVHLPRIVLTEDMLVDNPQVNLPLAINSENADAKPASDSLDAQPPRCVDNTESRLVETEQQEEIALPLAIDEHVMEQLVISVGKDVSTQLQALLPSLIKDSLHVHLASHAEFNKKQIISDDE